MMRIHYYLTGWLVFFFVIAGQPLFAQEEVPEDGFLGSIKAQVISAAQDRNKMEEENEKLKTELLGLQKAVEQHKEKLTAQDQKEIDIVTPSTELKPVVEEPSVNFDKLEDEAVVEEVQQIYLSGEYMALDGLQRLQEIQMYDLLLEKQELELERGSREMLHKKAQEASQDDLQAARMDIQKSTEKEEELSLKITELERAIEAYPAEIEYLKMENKALKEKIRKLK